MVLSVVSLSKHLNLSTSQPPPKFPKFTVNPSQAPVFIPYHTIIHSAFMGGKDKSNYGKARKSRLDKAGAAGGTEFIGFGAYASHASPSGGGRGGVGVGAGASASASASAGWSPAYSGGDPHVQRLFAKLIGKRDALTIRKTLHELTIYLLDEHQPRPSQAEALTHFAYMYRHRLYVQHAATLAVSALDWSSSPTAATSSSSNSRDSKELQPSTSSSSASCDSSAVRAACLDVWNGAYQRLPKATLHLLRAHPELVGMLYCLTADSASDVRKAAHTLDHNLRQTNNQNQNHAEYPFPSGLWSYAQFLLSMATPPSFYEGWMKPSVSRSPRASDLTPPQREVVNEIHSKLTSTLLEALGQYLASDHPHPSRISQPMDEDEEVGNALFGNDDWSLWCHATLHSESVTVRRSAYRLVARSVPRHAQLLYSFQDNHRWIVRLQSALSSESQPSNVPALLEALVATTSWCATAPSLSSSSSEAGLSSLPNDPRSHLEQLLGPPLIKLIRKSGLGAAAEAWGPTVLPLIAVAPHPLPLVQALTIGRQTAPGTRDQRALLAAQLECATYLLLRKDTQLDLDFDPIHSPVETSLSHSVVPAAALPEESPEQTLIQLWRKGLDAALLEESTNIPPPAPGIASPRSSQAAGASVDAMSRRTLMQTLVTCWVQLEAANRTQRECAFAAVRDMFWNLITECIPPDVTVATVTLLLQCLQEVSTSTDQQEAPATLCPHLVQPLRTYFLQHVSHYQSSSSSVPTSDSYKLYLLLFRFMGTPLPIFNSPRAIESFVMNDLLRWTILHTSRRSTVSQTVDLVRLDFELLAAIIGLDYAADADAASSGRLVTLWPNMLKEVIAAEVSLPWLRVGLQTILRSHPRAKDWVPCQSLDEYVTSLGRAAATATAERFLGDVGDLPDLPDQDKRGEERRALLRLCLGLSGGFSGLLVAPRTVSELVEQTCPPASAMLQSTTLVRSDPALLTVLLEYVVQNRNGLQTDEVHRVLFASWLQGGTQFFDETIHWLRTPSFTRLFQSEASELLLHQLDDVLCQYDINDEFVTPQIDKWSEAAWRLIQVARGCGTPDQCFDLTGLTDPSRWNRYPDILYACAVQVLTKLDAPPERLAILQSSNSDTATLLATMLVAVCEANADLAKTARVKFGRDRSACLLNLFGGAELNAELLDQLIASVLTQLLTTLTDESLVESSRRGVATLSRLVRARFRPAVGATGTVPKANAVCEGDFLWYINNPQLPELRKRVQVAKVHFDVQTGYYFTIRFCNDVESQERQTVLDRLRLGDQDAEDSAVSANAIANEERVKRSQLRDLIMGDIIDRYYSEQSWSVLVVELIGLLFETIGVGPERGLGTVHYKLIHRVRKTETLFLDALRDRQTAAAVDDLFALSLSLGYGWSLNLQPSSLFSQLAFDTKNVDQAILDHYDSNDVDRSMDSAVLAWLTLTVFIHDGQPESTGEGWRKVSLLFRLAKSHFEDKRNLGFRGSDLVATRALHAGFRFLSDSPVQPGADLLELAAHAARILILDFASNWESEPGQSNRIYDSDCDWRADSPMFEILGLWRSDCFDRQFIVRSMDAECCELLTVKLFVPSKRLVAAFLLDRRLKIGDPLFAGADLEDQTLSRVNGWVQNLEGEEADEVRDDVYIVSQWLPRRMMQEVEEWGEEVYEDTDDATTIGRLLTWICVLGAVEAAESPDSAQFRLRPAFVSYLSHSGAADAALNIAVLNDEAINDARGRAPPTLRDVQALLCHETCFTVPKISSLVLFLTVESVPSLSRRWWEQSCPKAYASDVQAFVEKWVAPEILNRELKRIRSNKDKFGAMAVRSSLASREVTANYVQDDFTLSVRITVPPDFPFKSANVDCSQTLGVPVHRSRRWSMQIARMLNNEGGTLQDALFLWKDNVDQEFQGVEACPICYSVLHVKTHKLPALECTICHNRFHVDCLTQWFRSSGKSQCVMCQQQWQGTRV